MRVSEDLEGTDAWSTVKGATAKATLVLLWNPKLQSHPSKWQIGTPNCVLGHSCCQQATMCESVVTARAPDRHSPLVNINEGWDGLLRVEGSW